MDAVEMHRRRCAATLSSCRHWCCCNDCKCPMLAADTDGVIVYTNPSFAAMLGHTVDDLVGKDVGDFLHPDSHSAITSRDVLRAAGSLLTWHHNEHGLAQSIVTKSVLIRSDDPVLLVGFVDVTDWLWSHGEGALPALH